MTPLRIIIYTRVSTDEQAENGTSMAGQEADCQRRAELLCAEVVSVCTDAGISGTRYQTRPGIQEALRRIEAGEAQAVVVSKLDRLGRTAKIVLDIAERIDRAGGRLLTCDGQELGGTSAGKMMLTMFAGVAEFERNTIRERTMSGRKRKAEQGEQPSRRFSPYGWHVVTKQDAMRGLYRADQIGTYCPLTEQVAIVQEMYARILQGQSLRQIAKWLNDTGVPTVQGGHNWQGSTVRSILTNPVHKGVPEFGRQQHRTDESRVEKGLRPLYARPAPTADRVTLSCEPIISADEWQAAQDRMTENKETSGGRRDKRFLLSGLLRCPQCNRVLMSSPQTRKGKTTVYYFCKHSRKEHAFDADNLCPSHHYRADRIEELTFYVVSELSRAPEAFSDALRAFQAEQNATKPDTTTERAKIQTELNALAKQETATATAQVNALAAGRDTAVYDKLLDGLNVERRTLQARLAGLEAEAPQQTTAQDFDTDAAKIAEQLRRVADVLDAPDEELTPMEKQAVLSTLIKAIHPVAEGGFRWEIRTLPGTVNVILISFDTTRADRLGCYGHWRRTSPHIDRLAEEGVLFADHFSPHIPTYPGHTCLMSGKDIYAHQVTSQSHTPEPTPGVRMLAEILSEQGYWTGAADNLGRWFARGIEHYQGYGWDTSQKTEWRKAEAVTGATLKVLDEAAAQDKPFYLFLHYWDPHTPYLPPAPFDRMFYGGNEKDAKNDSMDAVWAFDAFNRYFAEWMPDVTDIEFPKAQYDACIAYMDACFAHVLTRLDELGLTGETLIVATADHGEELDEHGCWFDHHGLYDTNIHIPLLMRCPDLLPAGVKINGLTSMLDVAPTILDLLELGHLAQQEGMEGKSLVPLINSPAPTARGTSDYLHITENTWMKKRGIRTHAWKLIVPLETPDLHGNSDAELYDLTRDPGELNNLIHERPDVVEELTRTLDAHIARRLAATGLPDPLPIQPIPLRRIGNMDVAVPRDKKLLGETTDEPTEAATQIASADRSANENAVRIEDEGAEEFVMADLEKPFSDEKIESGEFIGYDRDEK